MPSFVMIPNTRRTKPPLSGDGERHILNTGGSIGRSTRILPRGTADGSGSETGGLAIPAS